MLNLIDHLPRSSYFAEAMLADEEFAAQIAAMPDSPSSGERVSEWSPIREGLARVEDAVRFLQATVIASVGVKPPTVTPTVRPITAVDRARVNKRREDHIALVRRVLPDQT